MSQQSAVSSRPVVREIRNPKSEIRKGLQPASEPVEKPASCATASSASVVGRVVMCAGVALLAFALACASSGMGRTRSLVAKGHGADALPMLQDMAAQQPTNGEVFDLLGQAYYQAAHYEDAEANLSRAQSLGFWSAEGVLYRGLMRERAGDLDGAIRVYRSYPAIPSRTAQRKIRGRIQFLLRQGLREEMAQLVEAEAGRSKTALDRLTVAVFPFRYVGVSEDLRVLGRGLAEFLATDLTKVERLTVLERARLSALMEEIGLGASGLVDDRSALRMGKIAGAGSVLNGVYRDFPGGVTVESAVADVPRGRLENLQPAGGKLDQVFDLEKTIVFEAIARLGLELTEIEREDIQKTPTRSLLAFLEFSRGLSAEDAGNWPAAHQHYQAAWRADPGFKEAADKAQESAETDRVAGNIDRFEREFVGRPAEDRGGEGEGTDDWETAEAGGEDLREGQIPEEGGEGEGAGMDDWATGETGGEDLLDDQTSDILEDLADVATGSVDPGEASREPSAGGEAGPPTIVIDIDFP